MIQFLIDENLTPRLVGTAQEFGFVAFHVAHRGWASLKDPQVLRRVLDQNLTTTVINNWDDFRPMIARTEIHPGIVVILPNVRRERQIELFSAALTAITDQQPPIDMINTVLEVDASGTVTMYPLPDTANIPVP